MTLLKSKHVHKKHRVQYEIRTYYRFMHFLRLTGSTADTFLEYIQRNLPEGVAMKVTKVSFFHQGHPLGLLNDINKFNYFCVNCILIIHFVSNFL